MDKAEIIDVLDKVSDMEKLLTPIGGDFIPETKTIYDKPEFQTWKAELQHQLYKLIQKPLVVEALHVLEKGFKNGWSDQSSFYELKGKLSVISTHLEDYLNIQTKDEKIVNTDKLKRGNIIKTAFDEYTLIEQVGQGGNGKVFSATNGNGDSVAIKFVERNISAEKLKRFKNEIAFCEQHHHKNIVPILDRGYAYLDKKDFVFYVMPLYSDTLKNKIKMGISPDDAINIFIEILKGLRYAHEHNAVHRDIKPENILFAEGSNQPVICDFGIAHFAEEDLFTAIETKPGDRMANFYYAAPEQYKQNVVTTPQTDIYSVGLILNEMFTGEIPQAVGYKKIAEVNADYAYLDDVFEQIYRQNPIDRLYPEEKIFTEMKVRADQYKLEQEKIKLQNTIDKVITPENFNAVVVKKDFKNNNLIFTLNNDIPHEWMEIISSGNFGSYSEIMGYGPKKIKHENISSISMQLRGNEDPNTIRSIIKNIYDWIQKTNIKYTDYIKQNTINEQRQKEQLRKAEIERSEKENAILALLAEI